MKDKLRQFIETHRGEFDSEIPGHSVYERIGGKPNAKARRMNAGLFRRRIAIAASVLVLLITTFFLVRDQKKDDAPVQNETARRDDELFNADPVYVRQINQYQEIIGLQQEELGQLKKDYPDLYRQFARDIFTLDSAYRSLKFRLTDHPNRETLLEAMLENLELQSELLARQLLIIREIKQKNKSNEKTSI